MKLHIGFITSVSELLEYGNLNASQVAVNLKCNAKLSLFIDKNTKTILTSNRSVFAGKIWLIISFFIWSIFRQKTKLDILVTEPSITGICGFFQKITRHSKWVVDVWDIPFRSTRASLLIHLWLGILRYLFKKLYRYADLFLVSIVPEYEFRYFEIPKNKILLLSNAIWHKDLIKFNQDSKSDGSFNILCTRSLFYKNMGLDILAEAYKIVSKCISPISLTVIGDVTTESSRQLLLIKSLPHVTVVKRIDYNKLIKYVDKADVCVVPFRNTPDLAQTYPVKILEYLSMGKPVVASNITGIRMMIKDGYNGLLFKPGNAQDLADKIELLYKNNELRQKISRNARNLDKKYDCREKNKIILDRLYRLVENE